MWVEFVVGSLPYSERFFSRYSGFPLSLKPTLPNSNSIWNIQTHFNEFLRTLKCSLGKQITILLQLTSVLLKVNLWLLLKPSLALISTYQASDSKQMTGWGSLFGYSFLAFSTRELTWPEYMGFAVPLAVQVKFKRIVCKWHPKQGHLDQYVTNQSHLSLETTLTTRYYLTIAK